MTSIEFHLRSSIRNKRSKGSLFVRVIHGRIARSITIPCRVYPDEWDQKEHTIVFHSANKQRFAGLRKIEEELLRTRHFLENILNNFENEGIPFTSSDIITAYRRKQGGHLLTDFVDKLGRELEEFGRYRTARGYHTVVNRLTRFYGSRELQLKQITPILIRRFEYHLKQEGLAVNSISFYMRNLRAIYNKAIRNGLLTTPVFNPFEEVFTGVQVTRKRAISREEMIRIDRLIADSMEQKPGKITNTNSVEGLGKACLLFLFSFYARGMSFIDMAYLQKENLRNGMITYQRKKTGQLIEIKVTQPLQQIIRLFKDKTADSPFLLPIIENSTHSFRLQYESALRLQNERLKKIAGICGISKNLSTHVARHTWATIAKNEHLPLAIISEGLGHTSEKTTAIYLASFNHSVLHQANEKVINAIKSVG